MAWVRIDENFAQHPKVLKAGPLGMAMHVAALCYCNRHLTDGFVPKQIACMLLDLTGIGMRMWSSETMGGGHDAEWQMIVDDLVEAGLWRPIEGGWMIHDYLVYQPSREQVQRLKEVRSEVGRRGGMAKREQTAGNLPSKEPSKTTSKREAKVNPDPDPDPVSIKERVEDAPPSASPSANGKHEPETREARGKRLNLDVLPDEWRAFCAQQRPDLNPDATWQRFRDYWIAKPGKDGRKADWLATWRNWVRIEKGPNGQAAPKRDFSNY